MDSDGPGAAFCTSRLPRSAPPRGWEGQVATGGSSGSRTSRAWRSWTRARSTARRTHVMRVQRYLRDCTGASRFRDAELPRAATSTAEGGVAGRRARADATHERGRRYSDLRRRLRRDEIQVACRRSKALCGTLLHDAEAAARSGRTAARASAAARRLARPLRPRGIDVVSGATRAGARRAAPARAARAQIIMRSSTSSRGYWTRMSRTRRRACCDSAARCATHERRRGRAARAAASRLPTPPRVRGPGPAVWRRARSRLAAASWYACPGMSPFRPSAWRAGSVYETRAARHGTCFHELESNSGGQNHDRVPNHPRARRFLGSLRARARCRDRAGEARSRAGCTWSTATRSTPVVLAPYEVVVPLDLERSCARRRTSSSATGRRACARQVSRSRARRAGRDAVRGDRAAAREKIGADLIVMGTQGLTGLKHVLLGSVAERTLRLAPCPVLTLKAS